MRPKILLFFFFCFFSFINTIKINDNDFFTQQIRNLVRKIDRISKNNQDEKIMNILIEKLRYYIFNHDIQREGAERSKYENIRNISQNVSDDTEDGTYDIYMITDFIVLKKKSVSTGVIKSVLKLVMIIIQMTNLKI